MLNLPIDGLAWDERSPEVSGPIPPRLRTAEDLGIPTTVVADLTLKVLHLHGSMRGNELAAHLCIPFTVFEPALTILTDLGYLSSGGLGRQSHPELSVMEAVEWQLARGGQERARELMSLNQYAGP